MVSLLLNLCTLVVIFVGLFMRWWKKPSSRFPPGPRGIPLLGVLPFLGKYPQRVFRKWSRKYGSIMSVRMADRDVVFLNTYDVIKEAFVKQAETFAGRPPVDIFIQVIGNNGVTFLDYTEKFKAQKKYRLQSLKRFGMGKKGIEDVFNNEAQYFFDFMKTKVGKSQNMQLDFYKIVSNVICHVALGNRFDYEDPRFKTILQTLQQQYSHSFDATLIMLLLYYYKYLNKIPPFSGANERFAQAERDFLDLFTPVIEDHKNTFNRNCIRDYIDAYIYEQRYGQGKTDPTFTDRQLQVSIRDLFVAGTETTSTTVNWIFLCLLHFPEHHQKVLEEIDSVIGQHQTPSMGHRPGMPFICAFLQEVWRYCPVGPNAIQHRTTEDTMPYDFYLPKHTIVVPNVITAHFDPEVWPEPDVFDPYRHIDENGKFVYSPKIIPFSLGIRYCIGESLARGNIFLLFVGMLQKFKITTDTNPLPDLNDGHTSVVFSPLPYNMTLEIR